MPPAVSAADARVNRYVAASLRQTSRAKYAREFARYCASTERSGHAPLPVTPAKLARYVTERAEEAGSATSVEQWLAQVQGHARRAGTLEMTAAGQQHLAIVTSGLGNVLGRDYKQRAVINGEMLRVVAVMAAPAIAADPFLQLVWSHTLVAYHYLLRPNEHTGESRARLGHMLQGSAAPGAPLPVSLRLFDTKGTRRANLGPSAFETVYAYGGPGQDLDFTAPLALWVQRYGCGAEDLLFPGWDAATARPSRTTMSAPAYNEALGRLMRLGGFTSSLTAQGLRAGRRTDLSEAGVPEPTINRLGRWKSASASERYNRLSANVLRGTAGI